MVPFVYITPFNQPFNILAPDCGAIAVYTTYSTFNCTGCIFVSIGCYLQYKLLPETTTVKRQYENACSHCCFFVMCILIAAIVRLTKTTASLLYILIIKWFWSSEFCLRL